VHANRQDKSTPTIIGLVKTRVTVCFNFDSLDSLDYVHIFPAEGINETWNEF
jgi:hypothetical protein